MICILIQKIALIVLKIKSLLERIVEEQIIVSFLDVLFVEIQN